MLYNSVHGESMWKILTTYEISSHRVTITKLSMLISLVVLTKSYNSSIKRQEHKKLAYLKNNINFLNSDWKVLEDLNFASDIAFINIFRSKKTLIQCVPKYTCGGNLS